jgi:hypothetical protein
LSRLQNGWGADGLAIVWLVAGALQISFAETNSETNWVRSHAAAGDQVSRL